MKLTKNEAYPIKHDNGKIDKRYNVSSAINAKMEKGYNVYFCGNFVGFSLAYTYACVMCHEHNKQRFEKIMTC